MPRDHCIVHYKDLDFTVHAYLKVLNGGVSDHNHSRPVNERRWHLNFHDHKRLKKMVFAGKSDLKNAFRLLELSPSSWPWLIMKAQDPSTGIWKYFIDKCLPFGASISCAHFQHFSNALCHLHEHRNHTEGETTNYLDDFLFLALTVMRCNQLIQSFLDLCQEMVIPISIEKTEWGAVIVMFLGILLDGHNFCLGLPIEEHKRALTMLKYMIDQKKATVKELQTLCGFLNFIGWVVFPGRTFTRRMYAKFSNQMSLPGLEANIHDKKQSRYDAKKFVLKQHHHVRLDAEFKKDCETWMEFLSRKPLSLVVCRPMVDIILGIIPMSRDIVFYLDASAAKNLGFGCLLKSQWIQAFWEPGFIQEKSPSIEYLELFAMTAGLFMWQDNPELNNCRITLFCDNQAVVHMINNGMVSSCENCMKLLRMLVLNGLNHNRRISAKFVPSKQNILTDALSRGQWERFRRHGKHMNLLPDVISPEVWPMSKLWLS